MNDSCTDFEEFKSKLQKIAAGCSKKTLKREKDKKLPPEVTTYVSIAHDLLSERSSVPKVATLLKRCGCDLSQNQVMRKIWVY